MTQTLALTFLVPAAVVAIAFAGKRLRAAAVGNDRGIALQTVIIMVVLLAIAGSVAAVLLSTGGEAIDDLEAAGPFSTTVTTANCTSISIGSANGHVATKADDKVKGSAKGDCEFDDTSMSKGACELYRSSNGKGNYVSGDGCWIDLT